MAVEVANGLKNDMPLEKYTRKDSILYTQKKRLAYYRSNLPYVQPEELVLGQRNGKERTYVYVPVLQVMQKLLNRTDYISHFSKEKTCAADVYSSYRDSIFCQTNQLFSEDENALMIALYNDDWETVNPLGTSRKKHKLSAFYWTLVNLPSQYRAQLSAIRMAILARSADVKYFGLARMMEPLLRDLALLEKKGVYLESLGIHLRGTVAYVSADNLGAHAIGQFSESFSPNVSRICRFCMVTSADIQDIGKTEFDLRTEQMHSHHINMVSEGTADASTYGVRGESPLNSLQLFHVTRGLPPDVAHDLLEGIVPYEMATCLSDLIQKKYFTLAELNEKVRNFPYKHHDSVNRPQEIGQRFGQNSATIGGNCHENWTFLRLLPFMVGDKVHPTDASWLVLLELKDIVEYSFAHKITEGDLLVLESKIKDHKELLHDAFEDFHFKPKHHFVEHYPHLMRCFGPLVQCYTLRFEGKHSFFKKVIRHIMNFKNVCRSLAERHQLYQAYLLSQPTYLRVDYDYTSCSEVHVDMLSDNVRLLCSTRLSQNQQSVMQTLCVKINGMDYKPGLAVASGSKYGLPSFAVISMIIVDSRQVDFVCRNTCAWYIECLRAFELQGTETYVMLQPSDLADYYPLAVYTLGGKNYVTPKHHICVH